MKRLLVTLPLAIAFSGCSAPAAQNNAAAPAEAAPAATEAPTEAPALSYAVVEEAPADAPADFRNFAKRTAIDPPPADFKVADKPRVKLSTSKGDIVLELDAKAAPLHVKSFVYLVGKKYYDGVVFHRWADLTGDGKGYIIQGGDPFTKSPDSMKYAGNGGPGYQIPREHNNLKHDKLVIAAARSADPNSAGSQFYITQGPTYFLDENEGYTVFGKVVQGQDVALGLRRMDRINKATVVK